MKQAYYYCKCCDRFLSRTEIIEVSDGTGATIECCYCSNKVSKDWTRC